IIHCIADFPLLRAPEVWRHVWDRQLPDCGAACKVGDARHLAQITGNGSAGLAWHGGLRSIAALILAPARRAQSA
ncbi:hypothetical protein, partial [Shimia sp.]|uniref:hypothetical protein n=1 Tax=Shimia sp. TaxID=1954381 RepID=UPI0025DA9305